MIQPHRSLNAVISFVTLCLKTSEAPGALKNRSHHQRFCVTQLVSSH